VLGQDVGGLAPGYHLAREQQRLRKMGARLIEVMDCRDDGSPLAMPPPDERDQIRDGSTVDCRKWLIEQDDGCVLKQQARE